MELTFICVWEENAVSHMYEAWQGREEAESGSDLCTQLHKPSGCSGLRGTETGREGAVPIVHLTPGVPEHSEIDFSHCTWRWICQIKLFEIPRKGTMLYFSL